MYKSCLPRNSVDNNTDIPILHSLYQATAPKDTSTLANFGFRSLPLQKLHNTYGSPHTFCQISSWCKSKKKKGGDHIKEWYLIQYVAVLWEESKRSIIAPFQNFFAYKDCFRAYHIYYVQYGILIFYAPTSAGIAILNIVLSSTNAALVFLQDAMQLAQLYWH